MEVIYIIMKTKQTSTYNNMDFILVKVYGTEDNLKLFLKDTVSPDVIPFLRYFSENINSIVYVKSDMTCPHCGGELLRSY